VHKCNYSHVKVKIQFSERVQVVHYSRIFGNKRLIKCKQWSLSSIKVVNVVVCEFECVHPNYFMAEYPMKIPFII